MEASNWYIFEGRAHLVYTGEQNYTEFACGLSTFGDVKPADEHDTKCTQCVLIERRLSNG